MIENGDGLTAVGGSLWVKTDDGRVVRIDPATNRVVGELKLDTNTDPNEYCQGIGTDQTSVWACATTDSGTDVVQIDPASGRIVRRVAVRKVFDQLALPSTSRGLWVLSGSDVNLVDHATGRVTKYPLGVRCLQVAAAGDLVVATSSTENAVVALNAGNGSVIGRTTLPAPRLAAVSGSDVCLGRHERRSGPVVAGVDCHGEVPEPRRRCGR
jgi:outer membrane protein assembly factor BamB